MAYTPTTWVDYVTEANSVTMNNIEQGIAANDAAIAGKAATGHTHTSAQITDLAETVQDSANSAIVVTGALTKVYDDAAGTITLGVTPGSTDPEVVRDTMNAAFRASSFITVTADDTNDTTTIGTTATAIGTAVVNAATTAAARTAIDAAQTAHTHTTAQVTGLDAILRTCPCDIEYGTGTPPARTTGTTDRLRKVYWHGTTPPPPETTTPGGALPIDLFFSTA